MTHQYTNELINETSPYLLQHAHNPVNWNAWNDETLNEAKANNKLLLISIGYASCHWCHVMEHESFEDVEVAQIMNKNFINIKVDREERPDVDQVYMNAVQLMTGSGGWPLNVVALPDGRPVWGGTYFKKEQWMSVLEQISEVYQENPQKLIEYADKLEAGIKSLDVVNLNPNEVKFNHEFVLNAVNKWSQSFDRIKGGINRAPKFMMPNNLHFLMREAYQNNNTDLQGYVNLTLTKIAFGGVFDHVGGGFSRYSVDDKWHVPHFEKMLYDNAQLVSLYSDAYIITKNPLYKEVVFETLEFVKRELTDANGTFYSSLDADSTTLSGELEEGAFYVWTETELKKILGEDFQLFANYYNINDYGLWEHNNYVLIRSDSDQVFNKKYDISIEDITKKKTAWKKLLLKERAKRNRPRLDDKVLTSWNALMLKAYVDAYRVFNNDEYLEAAIKNAEFILSTQIKEDGGLYHNFKDGKSTINGYLEDYATVIDAYLSLYENTLDEKWLINSRNLANYTFDHFFNDESKMFYFTSDEDSQLVARTTEYRDNVIASSNSIMAKTLLRLSHYFDNEAYAETAKTMLHNVVPEIAQFPSTFSNWLDLMLNYTNNYYEVAIVGPDVHSKLKALNTYYLPNKLIIGSTSENNLPLLKNRFIEGKTLIYVCVNKSCKLPVSEVEQALTLIKE
ncbi:MAG: thioredoxin domain-containing protein [Flavobacteriaceae bacterium]|nr:thioredoxin domain-containing protein [Flavobacteriaceae bacterium]